MLTNTIRQLQQRGPSKRALKVRHLTVYWRRTLPQRATWATRKARRPLKKWGRGQVCRIGNLNHLRARKNPTKDPRNSWTCWLSITYQSQSCASRRQPSESVSSSMTGGIFSNLALRSGKSSCDQTRASWSSRRGLIRIVLGLCLKERNLRMSCKTWSGRWRSGTSATRPW